MAAERPLSSAHALGTNAPALEAARAWAEQRAFLLYEGKAVAHRSCGVAIAETFGRDGRPYVGLRRGGLTGEATCGAIGAGVLVLGEVFGAPDVASPSTPELVAAVQRYHALWRERAQLGQARTILCNDLTGQFAEFASPERHGFCTALATVVAGCVAQVLVEMDVDVARLPAPDR